MPVCGTSDRREHFFDAFPPARVPSYIEGEFRGESAGGFMSEMHEPATVRPPLRQFEQFLDSRDAAALLQIHPKTLQRLARKGEILGMRIGKLWRFRASDLDAWVHLQFASTS
jgi:excisionase family DNA binding protein